MDIIYIKKTKYTNKAKEKEEEEAKNVLVFYV